MLAHRVSGAVICLSFSHAEDEKIARIYFFAGEMERKGVNIKPRCLPCSRILSVVRRRNIPTIFSLIPYLLRINAKKYCKAPSYGKNEYSGKKTIHGKGSRQNVPHFIRFPSPRFATLHVSPPLRPKVGNGSHCEYWHNNYRYDMCSVIVEGTRHCCSERTEN